MNTEPILGRHTDPGRVRERNEDSYGYEFNKPGGHVFVVADGVGGENYGDVASQMAVKRILELYLGYYQKHGQQTTIEDLLHRVLIQANFEIFDEAGKRGTVGHMGTTAVVAVLIESKLHVAWIGDSRGYVISPTKNEARQITRDHTQVEERVRAGQLTAQQARVHPERNVLSRSLGGDEHIEPEAVTGTLEQGDYVLLCSDGLTRYADERIIKDYVLKMEPQHAAEELVQYAIEQGGKDNITVVIVQHGKVAAKAAAPVADKPAQPAATKRTATQEIAKVGGLPIGMRGLAIAAGAILVAVVFLGGILLGGGGGGDNGSDATATAQEGTSVALAEAVTEVVTADVAPDVTEEIAPTTNTVSPTPTPTLIQTATRVPTEVPDSDEPKFSEGDRVRTVRTADLYLAVDQDPTGTISEGTTLIIQKREEDDNPTTGQDGRDYYHVGGARIGWIYEGDLELVPASFPATATPNTVITPDTSEEDEQSSANDNIQSGPPGSGGGEDDSGDTGGGGGDTGGGGGDNPGGGGGDNPGGGGGDNPGGGGGDPGDDDPGGGAPDPGLPPIEPTVNPGQ